MIHGRNSSYADGCRCDDCRNAHRIAHNIYYHGNSEHILSQQKELQKKHPRLCKRCNEIPMEGKNRYCEQCKIIQQKETRERSKLKDRERGRDPYVREQKRLAAIVYREKYPERVKKANARVQGKQLHLRMYGLSQPDFESMVIAQDYRCAICGRKRKLGVDHDHLTGRVRALLCGSCNRGLGMFSESVEHLAQAIIYLNKFTSPYEQGRLHLA